MSRDDLRTLTSSADAATDQKQTAVTGTDVTVSGVDKRALDTFLAGGSVSAVPSGLSIAGKITTVTLGTGGWTALPATPLTARNSMAIQNLTSDQIILNFVSTVGVTLGWTVNPNGEYFIDITEDIILFGRAITGTPAIIVKELS